MMGSFQPVPLIAEKNDYADKRESDAGPEKSAKKPRLGNPDKAVRIPDYPDEEFKRRQNAKRCVMCGKQKHGVCTNKDATPFVA